MDRARLELANQLGADHSIDVTGVSDIETLVQDLFRAEGAGSRNRVLEEQPLPLTRSCGWCGAEVDIAKWDYLADPFNGTRI